MIDSEDIDAVERYIDAWHKQRATPGPTSYTREQEQEMAHEHKQHVVWFTVWARKAGLLNERASESVRTQ